MTEPAELARRTHRVLEPLHTVTYFAPEAAEVYARCGVKGGMRGYFAVRSAPMGMVPAEVVVATFYNFAPSLISTAIPSVWEVTTPEAITAARYEGVDAIYRRMLGDDVVASEEMAEAAALAREATVSLDGLGRPLYAGHAALDWPEPAHLQLFHAATLLREHRGDGHIAALVLAGLDGVEALVTYLPLGRGMSYDMVRATRGWSDEDWEAGVERVRARGLIDTDGGYTEAGQAQRDLIEAQTDEAAAAAYRQLGADRAERLRELVRPWAKSISEQLFGPAK